jgi:hypothetical protein
LDEGDETELFRKNFCRRIGHRKEFSWHFGEFLSPEEIMIIQNKIKMIELEDEESIHDVE